MKHLLQREFFRGQSVQESFQKASNSEHNGHPSRLCVEGIGSNVIIKFPIVGSALVLAEITALLVIRTNCSMETGQRKRRPYNHFRFSVGRTTIFDLAQVV